MILDLTTAVVAGVPLMLVVIGLVQFVKDKLGWTGAGVEVFAILLGLVLGGVYQAYLAEPALYGGWRFWFEALIYGLAVGLSATGIYKAYHESQKQ